MPKFAVVLAAAGKSSRFTPGGLAGTAGKKPFIQLAGKPVWQHSLDAFLAREDVVQIVVVVAPEDKAWFEQKYEALLEKENLSVVAGGAERFDSVAAAVSQVDPSADFIAIHDAARPCIDPIMVERVFAVAADKGNAVPVVPVSSTVKKSADGVTVDQTVDRKELYLSQTPQVFAADQLKDAFAKKGEFAPTDEAQLLEMLGWPVYLAAGCSLNRKLTCQQDIQFAVVALATLQNMYNRSPTQADPPDAFTDKRLA